MKLDVEMKMKMKLNISHILVKLPVRYGDEDIPYDFPLRDCKMWVAKINIDSGKIEGWPIGRSGNLYMKVCDEGVYTLLDDQGREVASIDRDYVPNGVIPGEYGDYVNMTIDENGVVTNWKENPDFSEFFGKGDGNE